jgi:hypothetical protein
MDFLLSIHASQQLDIAILLLKGLKTIENEEDGLACVDVLLNL